MVQNNFFLFRKLKGALKALILTQLAIPLFLILATVGNTLSAQTVIIKDANLKIGNSVFLKSANLILQSQGSLKIESGSYVQISSVLANNTGATSNFSKGTLSFNGDENSMIIGDNGIILNNLAIIKDASTAEVALRNDIQVDGILLMKRGDLDLGNFSINLGSTGIVEGETNENRIKATNGLAEGSGSGYIFASRNIEGGDNQNIAGLGLDVFSNSNLGQRIIFRYGKIIGGENYFTADTCAYRTFYLPTFNKHSSSNNIEVNFFTEELYSCVQVQDESIDGYDAYFLNFDSEKNGETVNLNWKVYGVMNMESFDLEASNDDINYQSLATFVNLGNEKTINNFSFSDDISNHQGNFKFYRLKQNDSNSPAIYYGPLAIDFNNNESFKPYFSGNDILSIETTLNTSGNYKIHIYNALSQQVFEYQTYIVNGFNLEKLDLPSLPNGIYIIKLTNENSIFSEKLVKKIE